MRPGSSWKCLKLLLELLCTSLIPFLELLCSAFYLLSISPICNISYVLGAFEDCANNTGCITMRHSLCTAARWMPPSSFVDCLVAKHAAKERLPLMNRSTVTAFCSFSKHSHLFNTVLEVLADQSQFLVLHLIH